MFFAIKSAKKTTKKNNQNFLTNQIKNVPIWIVNQTLRLKLEQQRGKEQKCAG